MKAKRGFTLVEILIVVVILGILAAIVIPQFTGAASEAKLSSLVSDLQSMRSQIELYKLQHNEALPSLVLDAAELTGLTGVTLINGTQVAAGTDNSYGPYLQKMPTDQFNNLSTVREDGAAAGANTAGWRFDTTTGVIYPDFIDMDGDTVSDGTETDY